MSTTAPASWGELRAGWGRFVFPGGRQIVAVAPVFSMRFSPEASFQSDDGAMPGLLRTVARWIQLPVICIGSPLAERCHIGWHPELNAMERRAALEALIDAVESQARITGVGLVAAKDILDDADHEICAVLAERGFVRLPGLPIATLDLSGVRDIEGYLATLSPSTRRDLRRKLTIGTGRAHGGPPRYRGRRWRTDDAVRKACAKRVDSTTESSRSCRRDTSPKSHGSLASGHSFDSTGSGIRSPHSTSCCSSGIASSTSSWACAIRWPATTIFTR